MRFIKKIRFIVSTYSIGSDYWMSNGFMIIYIYIYIYIYIDISEPHKTHM